MWVYFNVSETEYLNLKSGIRSDSLMHVQLLMANGQLFPYEGVVETIEADFNHETGNIAFRATFPNPDGLLRHGETGNIWMKTPIRNALLIPQKATFEILDKNYVYVLDEEGNIHARQIEIAEEMQHLYAVSKGLEPTDKILLEGLRKVKDGDHIEPKYTAPEVAFAQLGLYAE
jgi:membrane fusion protein (multidrug efflux system)